MIYAVNVYFYLGPKLKLVVQKHLAVLGVESLEARWSSSFNSISQVKGYSDRKYSRLLPLVMLALSGPEEALQWLLSQLLRYSSCGICRNTGCGDAQKVHLGFIFVPILLWSGIYLGLCTGTQEANVSPSGLILGGIPQGYSDCTWVASETSKVLMVRSWTLVWVAIRSTPGASPP